ncbi:MAG: BON domain-containing protein [Planctomycetaceae bacterium]|jgi:osmotically-inducible protein OsmY|nr:BON domain-containing protein [Planctomycetaceae bacterium]
MAIEETSSHYSFYGKAIQMKTDSELKQDVENELKWEPMVNEAHIGVTANGGVVSLAGHVLSFAEKYAAEKSAKRVYGVKAVANELDIRLHNGAMRSDEQIAQACLSALKNHSLVPYEKLKVVVSDGIVSLEGEVDWQYQRDAALNAVRDLIGVVSVTTRISIKARTLPKDVKNKIIAAFHRNADIDARRIEVQTQEGKVVLHGNVRSWSEREQAQSAAWAAPGVTAVENDIVVVP